MDNQNKNRTGFKKALSIVLMGTICLTAAVSVSSMSKKVTVTDGNKTVTIDTVNPDTNAILEKTGVELGNNDKLVRTDDSDNGINISILRGVAMDTVNKDAEASINESSSESFLTAGMQLSASEADALASVVEASNVETEIKLTSVKLTINLRGKKLEKEVPAGTVKDALSYLNIKIGKNDVMNVTEDTAVEDGMKIVIKNIKYKTVKNVETIDYETEYKDTDSLYEGETEVETQGVEGERTIVTKEKYVNDKLDSSELVSDEITKKAVNKVVLRGTAQKVNNYGTVSVNESSNTITDIYGNQVSYSHVLRGPATAYYAPSGALTSTGRLARYGVVAVDPSEIPYGSILYIVSDDGFVYGYAVAGDTGGFIYYTDVLVDLYFPTYDDCCNFGLRNVSVYVLEGVSEDATY